MLDKFFVEWFGTFIFLSVIIITGEVIPICIALAAAIYFGGKISGGAVNPAVATMMYMNKTLNMQEYIGYVFFQILGAICALYFYKSIYLKYSKK